LDRNYQTNRPAGQLRSVEASPTGILRSALVSGAAALAVLVVVYLPAEYGRDPTGFGAVLGLTEMGQIKQQLYAEAEADAVAAPVTLDPAVMARLEAIEARLAAISDIVGAPSPVANSAGANPAPLAPPSPAALPDPIAQPSPAEPALTAWRDEGSYSLAPGEGIEVKLVMQQGQTAQFEWTANGAVVNFDTHGDGSGQKISYEQGRGVAEQSGELTAAFTGNHGWFWRNRTDAPVVVTLRTRGEYSEVRP
jgi:hypothetical protein